MKSKLPLILGLVLFSIVTTLPYRSDADSARACSNLFNQPPANAFTALDSLRQFTPHTSSKKKTSIDQSTAHQLEQWILKNPAASPHLDYRYGANPALGQVFAPIVALHLKALQIGISKEAIKNIWIDLGDGSFAMALAIKSSDHDWFVYDSQLKGMRTSLDIWSTDFLNQSGADAKKIKISFTDSGKLPDGTPLSRKFLFGPSMVDYTVGILDYLKNENVFKEKNEKLISDLNQIPLSDRTRAATEKESEDLFQWISNHPIISYKAMDSQARENYCHLRAMGVHFKALEMGISHSHIKKLWVFGHFDHDQNQKHWGFHVATALRLQNGDWIVLDPLLEKAVTVAEWFATMKQNDTYDLMQMIATDPNMMTPYFKANITILDLANPRRFGATGAQITQRFLKSFFKENKSRTGDNVSLNLGFNYPLLMSKELKQFLK